jgi:hypothetical protein
MAFGTFGPQLSIATGADFIWSSSLWIQSDASLTMAAPEMQSQVMGTQHEGRSCVTRGEFLPA